MKFKINQPVKFINDPSKTGIIVGVFSGSFVIVLLDVPDKKGNRAVVVVDEVLE